jgi:SAM-dependent methyltransferase
MGRLSSITVPDHLQRNAPNVLAEGVEETGESLLERLAERIGRADLAGLDLLDIGCGVRFTQTLINRDLPFASYTGVEVSLPIVQWLKEHVESKDERFRFVHWNVHNALYNRQAPPMDTHERLPVAGDYHLVMGFSLFTHLAPHDTGCMLHLTRKVVRREGFLFFSAFCDDSVAKFEDRVPEKPLAKAYYNKRYLEDLIGQAGWALVSWQEPAAYIMSSFLCKPV